MSTPEVGIKTFRKVSVDELGKFKDHEMSHAKYLEKYGIRYEFFLSSDNTIAATVPNDQDFDKHAKNLNNSQFVNFLLEYHNPENLPTEKLSGTDYMVVMILSGKFGKADIDAWVIADATRS